MVEIQNVKGKNKGKIFLYSLSTCVWCKKTKELLEELDVQYSYVFMDKLEGNERDEQMKNLRECNPRSSFPTLVINDDTCIIGFKEDEIRKVLE